MIRLGIADARTAAATTSLYVLLNSAAALSVHVVAGGTVEVERLAVFGVICMLGAFVGSRFGALRASPRQIELIFGGLILIASVRLVLVLL